MREVHAAAIAVVSNGTGHGPDANSIQDVLSHPATRDRILDELVQGVREWDGIVLDFEKVPSDKRQEYVQFVSDFKAAVARPVAVAVPAFTGDAQDQPYDLAALAETADQIIWMAYDQHYATSEPGPVAGYPWVEESVEMALAHIPPRKLVLGLPTYGYHWSAGGSGQDITFSEGNQLADVPSAHTRYDPIQQEQHVTLSDGGQAWYSNARSTQARAHIALNKGMCGVALWRSGIEDPATLGSLPFRISAHP
jgi:spore germination protein YaaH